jgi:hypothetical protein
VTNTLFPNLTAPLREENTNFFKATPTHEGRDSGEEEKETKRRERERQEERDIRTKKESRRGGQGNTNKLDKTFF